VTLQRLFYKPAEAAVLLSIGRTRFYDELRSGRLRSIRHGGSRLIPADALAEFAALLDRECEPAAAGRQSSETHDRLTSGCDAP
jgi:excisionase family DNA binding protein